MENRIICELSYMSPKLRHFDLMTDQNGKFSKSGKLTDNERAIEMKNSIFDIWKSGGSDAVQLNFI